MRDDFDRYNDHYYDNDYHYHDNHMVRDAMVGVGLAVLVMGLTKFIFKNFWTILIVSCIIYWSYQIHEFFWPGPGTIMQQTLDKLPPLEIELTDPVFTPVPDDESYRQIDITFTNRSTVTIYDPIATCKGITKYDPSRDPHYQDINFTTSRVFEDIKPGESIRRRLTLPADGNFIYFERKKIDLNSIKCTGDFDFDEGEALRSINETRHIMSTTYGTVTKVTQGENLVNDHYRTFTVEGFVTNKSQYRYIQEIVIACRYEDGMSVSEVDSSKIVAKLIPVSVHPGETQRFKATTDQLETYFEDKMFHNIHCHMTNASGKDLSKDIKH